MLRPFYQPYALAFLIPWLILGVLWYRRRERRWVLIPLTLGLGIITTINIPVASIALLATLERSYVEEIPTNLQADAIVVLGGFARYVPGYEHGVMTTDTLHRCIHAVEIYRRSGITPIVVTGGDAGPTKTRPVSGVMADYLQHYGISSEDLILETRSQNTFENARECKALLDPLRKHRILLVTSATHMNRSVETFRNHGFEVIAAPCHFLSRDHLDFEDFLPQPRAPREFMMAAHEWVGLLWYRLRG